MKPHETFVTAAPSRLPDDIPRRHIFGVAAGIATLGLSGGVAAGEPERLSSMPLELAFQAIVTLGPAETVGVTPLGKRVRIPITGGTFTGPRIGGTILPEGMDWQLIRADGFTLVEAAYLMREKDGTLIHIVNKGVAGNGYVRTTPVFEVPLGPHQWLNESVFTGTIGPVPESKEPAVRITVYRIL